MMDDFAKEAGASRIWFASTNGGHMGIAKLASQVDEKRSADNQQAEKAVRNKQFKTSLRRADDLW